MRSYYGKNNPVLSQSTIEGCGISDIANLVISSVDQSITYTGLYPDEATGRQIYESQTYIGYSFIGTDDATGVRSRYEFAFSGATDTIAIASIIPVNAAPPEPTVTSSATTVHRTTPFDVDVTFSREVTGFDPVSESSDFSITNATITAVSQSGATYTLTVVPSGGGDMVMSVPASAAQDFAGTPSVVSSPVTVVYDPNVVLTEVVGMPNAINASPFDVTVVFDNDVSGFDPIGTPGDVSLTNANVTAVSAGPSSYTLTLTPTGAGNVTLSVPAGIAENAAGDQNTASNEVTAFFNANAPSVEIIGAPAAFNGVTPFDVTVRFSAPVIYFQYNQLNITNATVTGPPFDFTPAVDFVITITPTDTGDITIAVPASAAYSQSSFAPNIPSAVVTILSDITRPTVSLSSSTSSVVGTTPFTITATFSEDVFGFDDLLGDLVVTNGAATAITPTAPDVYEIEITPTGTGPTSIVIPENAAQDGAMNGNLASGPVSLAQADTEAPGVVVSGAPDSYTQTTPFTLDVTFSEDVFGFDDMVADLTVANATVTDIAGGPAAYTVDITPTGAGDITVMVPAGAAQDGGPNDNTESNTVSIGSTTVADTQRAISEFMAYRMNALTSNQPELTHFLLDGGCGSFDASASEDGGAVSGCASRGGMWAALSGSWSDGRSYTLASIGSHHHLSPDLLIGGMLQFDSAKQRENNAFGEGWLAGPYFVAKASGQPLYFEGRLLYGQTRNSISPYGGAPDRYDTERWLAQIRTSGKLLVEGTTLIPLLDVSYTQDAQKAYVNGVGDVIPGQKLRLTQVTAGMNFRTPLETDFGDLTLTGGLSSIYSSLSGATSDYEGLRARISAGGIYQVTPLGEINVSSFYDGIGSDYESYGLNMSFNMKF
ncbi:MAG: Ig-like domain-containing protein [Halocynthiibacter sp.]